MEPFGDGVVRDVALRTLEQSAFMFGWPVPPGRSLPPGELEARVAFAGPDRGELILSASPAFARALAANLLALDPDDPLAAESGPSSLLELANILAGMLAYARWGDARCELGLPFAPPPGSAVAGPSVAAATLLIDEEHPLHVRVHVAP